MRVDEIGKWQELSRGSEGIIYRVLSTGKCIKIFHSKDIAKKKEEKIKCMVGVTTLKNRHDISWPLECVYGGSGEFIGYMMNCAPTKSVPLTRYFNSRMYQIDTYMLVHCAINLTRICKIIHDLGITICDFNPSNFLITDKGDCFLVDTDNYQFQTSNQKQYKPAVACSRYLDKHLQNLLGDALSLGVQQSEFVIGLPYGSFNRKTDIFGMSVLIFQILMNGTHPFQGNYDGNDISLETNIYHDYAPYFGKGNPHDLGADKPSINIMTKEVARLFYDVFFKSFDVGIMEKRIIDSLVAYSHDLNQTCQVNNNHHYINGILKCPWCELNRIKDPWYAENSVVSQNVLKSGKTNKCQVSTTKNYIGSPVTSNNNVNATGLGLVSTNNPSTRMQQNMSNQSRTSNINNFSHVGANSSVLTINSYNATQAKSVQKKNREKAIWMWIVFVLVCIAQIYTFQAGYIKDFYAVKVGGPDNMMILGGLAQYLFLITGIAIALFITLIFINIDFSICPTVLLNMGSQVVAYFVLLWMVAIFVSVASIVLIIVLIGALIGAFLSGL